jgi:hypothetical protein
MYHGLTNVLNVNIMPREYFHDFGYKSRAVNTSDANEHQFFHG